MKLLVSYLSISLILVLSCSSMHSGLFSKKQLAKLDGSWELIELLGNSDFEGIYVEQNPFIVLSLEEGKINGNSGCNNFFGKLEISGPEIDIKEMGSTKMFCSDVPEDEFFNALDKVSGYKIKGDLLEFIADGKTLLKFRKMND